MKFKYKKEVFILTITFILCLSIFTCIKKVYFSNTKVNQPIENVIEYYNNSDSKHASTVVNATTKIVSTTNVPSLISSTNEDEEEYEASDNYSIPYMEAPTFIDDGSIIYDGMTITELTNKLNKSLSNYLTNTGYFFAKFTKDTGMDPYLSVAIVLHETGCKWACSTLTTECNNIGGLKGGTSCMGKSYRKYDTLEEGIEGYLSVIYNNYYINGLDTPEKMAAIYATGDSWKTKVRSYMEEIKSN
jgi:hypothetical protein